MQIDNSSFRFTKKTDSIMSLENSVDSNGEIARNGSADGNRDPADDASETRENGHELEDAIANSQLSILHMKSTQAASVPNQKSDGGSSKTIFTLPMFVVNISLLILCYIFMMVYYAGVVRTLERRFGLSSVQTGFINSANDISHVCIVVFIGYLGRTGHKPRIICVTVLFSAFAGFMMASPHFLLSSTYDTVPSRLVDSTDGKTTNSFCLNWNTSGEAISGDQCDQLEQGHSQTGTHPAYYILLIAQFIGGIGDSGIHTLSLAYIDENTSGSKSSLYIGICLSMYSFGVLGGMMLASMVLRLPENLLSSSEISPSDPSWIGCWWLGYVICATGLLVTAIPLWFFPKSHFVKTAIADTKEKAVSVEKSSATAGKTSSLVRQEISEFPRRLLHLLRNKPYLVSLFSVVCGTYVLLGLFANLVRYIEIHFLESAFVGSLIAGLSSALSGAIGGILGGLLMSKLKIRPPGAVKVILFSSICLAIGVIVVLFLQCPQLQMAGQIDPEENRFTVLTDCNNHCACSTSRTSYAPVCGSDNLTYFSACTAGCRNLVNGTYSDCGCIGSDGGGGGGGIEGGREGGIEGGWARPGLCLPPCNLLIPFAVILFVTSFIGSFARAPSTIVNLRIVDDDERAFALSLNSFAMNLLGWVPAPLFYGSLVDSTCIMWQTTCKTTGNCLLYDTDRFRYVTYGVVLVFTGIDILLTIVLFLFVRKMVFRVEVTDRKENRLEVEETQNDNEKTIETRI